jgi:hypothetical protein
VFLLLVLVFIRTRNRPLMSRPPYQTYPHHHPHHGQPYIVVNDHDVLCGRGVNISQHPGNERFRALVNTRTDESYCTSFTTSEKRALADEIINHIQLLDPPGRFLKRSGRSQSSRGLNGPWEELSPKECIKKACQALRDCNRTDRSGYAAQVHIPEDVKENAEERAITGLSLKEHAAAAVAKTKPVCVLSPPTSVDIASLCPDFNTGTPTGDYRKRVSNEISSENHGDDLIDTDESADAWIKRQRTEGSVLQDPESSLVPISSEADTSALTNIHSTPAPYVAPVPVTSTPPNQHQPYTHNHAPGSAPIAISHHPPSPQEVPSLTVYQHDPHALSPITASAAPYSPALLLTPHEAQAAADGIVHLDNDILEGPDDFADDAPYSHHDPHLQHFHHFPSHSNSTDILQSAADAAAALTHNSSHTFPMLGSDDGTHGSLGISDL